VNDFSPPCLEPEQASRSAIHYNYISAAVSNSSYSFRFIFSARSIASKKNSEGGSQVKESTDSSTTIEDVEDNKGEQDEWAFL
jgi:hypothetical protein